VPKKEGILFVLLSTLCNFAVDNREVTPSRQKKKRFSFVLLSTFRNFGFAEVTGTWK
jgi:hypothetical protein